MFLNAHCRIYCALTDLKFGFRRVFGQLNESLPFYIMRLSLGASEWRILLIIFCYQKTFSQIKLTWLRDWWTWTIKWPEYKHFECCQNLSDKPDRKEEFHCYNKTVLFQDIKCPPIYYRSDQYWEPVPFLRKVNMLVVYKVWDDVLEFSFWGIRYRNAVSRKLKPLLNCILQFAF